MQFHLIFSERFEGRKGWSAVENLRAFRHEFSYLHQVSPLFGKMVYCWFKRYVSVALVAPSFSDGKHRALSSQVRRRILRRRDPNSKRGWERSGRCTGVPVLPDIDIHHVFLWCDTDFFVQKSGCCCCCKKPLRDGYKNVMKTADDRRCRISNVLYNCYVILFILLYTHKAIYQCM